MVVVYMYQSLVVHLSHHVHVHKLYQHSYHSLSARKLSAYVQVCRRVMDSMTLCDPAGDPEHVVFNSILIIFHCL